MFIPSNGDPRTGPERLVRRECCRRRGLSSHPSGSHKRGPGPSKRLLGAGESREGQAGAEAWVGVDGGRGPGRLLEQASRPGTCSSGGPEPPAASSAPRGEARARPMT